MSQVSIILIFTIFIQVIHCEVKTYTCKVIEKEPDTTTNIYDSGIWSATFCVLKGLNVISSDKLSLRAAKQTINKIDAIEIKLSKLEVLTDDICKSLPFIRLFDVRSVGLTAIEENAFEECTNLKLVILDANHLTTLPPRMFHWNWKLTEVRFWANNLTKIAENLFENNKKLAHVDIGHNRLTYLPKNLFKNNPALTTLMLNSIGLSDVSFLDEVVILKRLTKIYLHDNHLADVNVESLILKFPNLNTFWLHENEFWCDRQMKMYKFLDAKDVDYGKVLYQRDIDNDKTVRDCIADKDVWKMKMESREMELNIFLVKSFVAVLQDEHLLIWCILVSTSVTLIYFLWVKQKKLPTKLD